MSGVIWSAELALMLLGDWSTWIRNQRSPSEEVVSPHCWSLNIKLPSINGMQIKQILHCRLNWITSGPGWAGDVTKCVWVLISFFSKDIPVPMGLVYPCVQEQN